jgi:hypothetical protein
LTSTVLQNSSIELNYAICYPLERTIYCNSVCEGIESMPSYHK